MTLVLPCLSQMKQYTKCHSRPLIWDKGTVLTFNNNPKNDWVMRIKTGSSSSHALMEGADAGLGVFPRPRAVESWKGRRLARHTRNAHAPTHATQAHVDQRSPRNAASKHPRTQHSTHATQRTHARNASHATQRNARNATQRNECAHAGHARNKTQRTNDCTQRANATQRDVTQATHATHATHRHTQHNATHTPKGKI